MRAGYGRCVWQVAVGCFPAPGCCAFESDFQAIANQDFLDGLATGFATERRGTKRNAE
jgi:hypothetical protein